MMKTHGAGHLRASHAGEQVTLAGWVHAHRDHGGVLFFDLRDASGLAQVVVPAGPLADAGDKLRAEWCVSVTGEVRLRPEGTENSKLETGAVEVVASSIDVLSTPPPLPFQIADEGHLAEEATRLRYRYMDLRRAPMLAALRTRDRMVKVMHDYFHEFEFLEVETPVLALSTPEGARDFLVPSRLQAGSFYALVQSPQIFKQILMVSGVERYYQIAKCFRDENLRANRQPEFMQLDLEMSFVTPEDIYSLTEEMLARIWRECLGSQIQTPFLRMTYAESMDRYGNDRPDLRAGPAIEDLSDVFASTGFQAFASAEAVRGLRVAGAGSSSRKQLDDLTARARELGAAGLVWMAVEGDGVKSPVAKFLTEDEIAAIRLRLNAGPGDLMLLVADKPRLASEVLGSLRVELARRQGLIRTGSDPADWRFLWVVDFPMFEWNVEERRWDATHNPFSAPTAQTEQYLDSDPARCIAQQYDVVLNGEEIGGGSIRNHRPEMQMKALAAMGFPEADAKERFGFFLEALSYAAPPHGGIAMGLDRLTMLLTGGTSLRDVMPFPKTQTGSDLLTGAPAPVDPKQLRDLGLQLREQK